MSSIGSRGGHGYYKLYALLLDKSLTKKPKASKHEAKEKLDIPRIKLSSRKCQPEFTKISFESSPSKSLSSLELSNRREHLRASAKKEDNFKIIDREVALSKVTLELNDVKKKRRPNAYTRPSRSKAVKFMQKHASCCKDADSAKEAFVFKPSSSICHELAAEQAIPPRVKSEVKEVQLVAPAKINFSALCLDKGSESNMKFGFRSSIKRAKKSTSTEGNYAYGFVLPSPYVSSSYMPRNSDIELNNEAKRPKCKHDKHNMKRFERNSVSSFEAIEEKYKKVKSDLELLNELLSETNKAKETKGRLKQAKNSYTKSGKSELIYQNSPVFDLQRAIERTHKF